MIKKTLYNWYNNSPEINNDTELVCVEDVREFIRRINELNSEDTEWVLEDFNNELSEVKR